MSALFEDIPLTFVLLQLVFFFAIVLKLKDRYIIRPSILLPSILIFYPLIGLVNLKGSQIALGWYKNVDPYKAYIYTAVATILLMLPMLFTDLNKHIETNKIEFDYVKMWRWIKWGTIIGFLLNLLNFYSIGGIPIFWSNLSGFERFDLAEKLLYPRFFYINSSLITLNLIYLSKNQPHKILGFIFFVVNIIIAYSIGSRHLIMLPLVIAAIYIAIKKRFPNWIILVSVFVMAFLIFVSLILRGDRYSLEFASFFFSFGGEYRDFVLLRDYFNFSDFQYGKTLLPIITNIIPKQIYMLFDVDKKDLAVYSAYITEQIWGADTGIRVGIWGEFFINFAETGVLIGFLIFGFFSSKLDKAIYRYKLNDVNVLLLSFAYTLFLFSIIGSWATIGDTLQSYGVIYIIFAFFMKQPKSETRLELK